MLKLAFHDLSAKQQRVCSFEFAWGGNVFVDVAQSMFAHIVTINFQIFKLPLKIKVVSYANEILGSVHTADIGKDIYNLLLPFT